MVVCCTYHAVSGVLVIAQGRPVSSIAVIHRRQSKRIPGIPVLFYQRRLVETHFTIALIFLSQQWSKEHLYICKMDFGKIKSLNTEVVEAIAADLGISSSFSRKKKEGEIIRLLSEYQDYMHAHQRKFRRQFQIGNEGKEGVTYLVKDTNNIPLAMKVFRKTKSPVTLRNEADLQQTAAIQGAAPRVVEVDTVMKTITMERMDRHLLDVILSQRNLTEYQQRGIVRLFNRLDDAGVFHGDSNLLNYMLRGKRIYLIDYGMSKLIDDKFIKKVKTSRPNITLMALGFILKLKELGLGPDNYRIIADAIPRCESSPGWVTSCLTLKWR